MLSSLRQKVWHGFSTRVCTGGESLSLAHSYFRPRAIGRIIPLAAVAILAAAGCHTPPKARREPPPLIPLAEAAEILNRNIERVTGTLRASGTVDGSFVTPEGRRTSYSVSGVLFYLAPTYVRFDLKKLGDRQFLFGSNEESYWVYAKSEDDYFCGRHGAFEDLPAELPIRPDQIPAALGLEPISAGVSLASLQQAHRVTDEHQQLLFMAPDAAGRLAIEKEYWLDRFPPNLVRQVVFRNSNGAIEMTSVLGEYRATSSNGPILPMEMAADWPEAKAQMRFRIRKWELVPQVGPGGPQFATPAECGESPSNDRPGRRK